MGYFVISENYRSIFGGSPFDPEATALYQRLSPTFRAEQAAGPVLQQVAGGSASQLAFHVRSEEHTSELQSLMRISYAVFCLKKKKSNKYSNNKYTQPHHKHPHIDNSTDNI